MKDNYITATLEMIKSGTEPDAILQGLQATLKKHGHERLYASILRGVERVLSADSAQGAIVAVAKSTDLEKHRAAIATTLQQLGSTAEPAVSIDESLIGGYIAEANNKRLDQSYKSKLVSLYRNLTN